MNTGSYACPKERIISELNDRSRKGQDSPKAPADTLAGEVAVAGLGRTHKVLSGVMIGPARRKTWNGGAHTMPTGGWK